MEFIQSYETALEIIAAPTCLGTSHRSSRSQSPSAPSSRIEADREKPNGLDAS